MFVVDIIKNLQNFWEDKGCAVMPGYDYPVGAGTFHPMSLYNLFASPKPPKPYKACMLQKCRRPDDGRGLKDGDRMSIHHQMQVILFPDPVESQRLYIESLQHLGISRDEYMINFFGDNWESPTLGAYGVGWEAHCNGMETTQITHFHQVGGITLKEKILEIAYGVERIAMLMQKTASMLNIMWDKNNSIKDILQHQEPDLCSSYQDKEYGPYIKELYDKCAALAKLSLTKSLPFIAYEYSVQACNYFNILDANGAFGEKERQNKILEIRKINKEIFKILEQKNEIIE